ncbi:MAG: hypothetical protein PUG91_02180, partial [Clostridiales bacterium]|nr:hypothetical protein [Clostridiales bacterium]MDY2872831.1 hypothetical protein [Eubacteriales bacterium]
MIIQNVTSGKTPLENSFVALDRQANSLGRCDVEPLMNEHLMPGRPYELKLSVQGRPEARLQLYAAGIARAMALARAQSGVNARIYTECPVQNGAQMEQLRSLGFIDDDARIRMRRRIVPGSSTAPLPAGCTFVNDRLGDPVERAFFLKRAEKLFKLPEPEAWLDAAVQRPCFRRFLLTTRDGLAGELLCWARTQQTGVIGLAYTTPAWRRRGVGGYLMEVARDYFYQSRIAEAICDVRWQMSDAVNLAARAGYRRSETLMRLPGINVDALGA